jgi:apolipoprotein N-acyltransferase
LERHNGGVKSYNSAFLIAEDGEVKGKYNKIHLVPYGEYVPLKEFFPFIEKMVVGIGDFSPGETVRVLSFSEKSFGTLICYEIIFPDLVRKFANNGANFLVNITNDAWFGKTGAPYQHLSMAVFRAIENRRFIARAANTGISAFIDSRGKIFEQTKLFTQETLTGNIYVKTQKTFYTRAGDLFAILCLGVSMFFVGIAYAKKFAKSEWLRGDSKGV